MTAMSSSSQLEVMARRAGLRTRARAGTHLAARQPHRHRGAGGLVLRRLGSGALCVPASIGASPAPAGIPRSATPSPAAPGKRSSASCRRTGTSRVGCEDRGGSRDRRACRPGAQLLTQLSHLQSSDRRSVVPESHAYPPFAASGHRQSRPEGRVTAQAPGGEVLVYEAPDGAVRVDVRLERDTVWLRQEQMGRLFGRERSVDHQAHSQRVRGGRTRRERQCAKFAHCRFGQARPVLQPRRDHLGRLPGQVPSRVPASANGPRARCATTWCAATPSTASASSTTRASWKPHWRWCARRRPARR